MLEGLELPVVMALGGPGASEDSDGPVTARVLLDRAALEDCDGDGDVDAFALVLTRRLI